MIEVAKCCLMGRVTNVWSDFWGVTAALPKAFLPRAVFRADTGFLVDSEIVAIRSSEPSQGISNAGCCYTFVWLPK